MRLFPRSRRRIRREAADWVVRLEGAPEEVRADFRRWRDSDPRNGEAYARMSGIWDAAGRLPPAPAEAGSGSGHQPSRAPLRLALAAAILLSLAAASLLLLSARSVMPRPGGPEALLLASDAGEVRQIALAESRR